MIVRFIIPNRDDAGQPPTLYENWGANAVPREGETVVLNGQTWRVKWVCHTFSIDENDRGHHIEVRLIEPDHWSQK